MTEDHGETQTLYRWVSSAELEDFRNCGELRPNPDGSGYRNGKLVTNRAGYAIEWGEMFGEYPDEGAVLEIVLEIHEGDRVEPFNEMVDGIGPAYHLTLDDLEGADVHER